MVNHERIHILEQDKVERIREAILKRRMGDGKISPRQIYKLLQTMVPDEINKFERDAVMEAVADLLIKIMKNYHSPRRSWIWQRHASKTHRTKI